MLGLRCSKPIRAPAVGFARMAAACLLIQHAPGLGLAQSPSMPVGQLMGTGAPAANCFVGQTYYRTDAVAGYNEYYCTAPPNVWTQSSYLAKYGEAWFYTATGGSPTSMAITAVKQYHGIVLASSGGTVSGWTHKVGAAAVVSSVADNGGGTILVTTAAPHGFAAGDYVAHTGFATRTTYRGKYKVLATPIATTYTVTRAFEVASDTGFAQRAFSLRANTGSAGVYRVSFSMTAEAIAATTDFKTELNLNTLDCDNIAAQLMYQNASRPAVLSSSGLITIADDDVLWLSISNLTDTTDIGVWHCNLTATRM